MAEGNIIYSRAEKSDEQREKEEEELCIQIEELSVNERKKRMARCESCVGDECPEYEGSFLDVLLSSESLERASQLYGRVAIFLCFVCKIYVCAECMSEHRGHNGMNVGRKESERQEREEMGGQSESGKNKEKGFGKEIKGVRLEAESDRKKEKEENESDRMRERGQREGKRRQYIDMVLNESERTRTETFNNSHAIVYDRVEVKHELDQTACWITGLCGLENKRWVACDYWNECIKIYKVGSHVLQRYIRFVGLGPRGVTEMHLKQNSAEPNLVSGSSSDTSATDRADPDKQCLIAVTLPGNHQIVFIDISTKPVKLQKVLKTERPCLSIQFYDDKIFTFCGDVASLCYVYIISTNGVTLNIFDTGIYSNFYTSFFSYPAPFLAVVSGRVYITDGDNHKVQCRDVEGQVISEFTIEGSRPEGIYVDPDNNVYVCASFHNKVYKLDSDLTRYKSVLDQTAGYIEAPHALCCYRDKLFISHFASPSIQNFVTVVRLL